MATDDKRGVSLTQSRLQAIRDALAYRLASRCPGDPAPMSDYREALRWATEESVRRGYNSGLPRPIPTGLAVAQGIETAEPPRRGTGLARKGESPVVAISDDAPKGGRHDQG